MTIHSLTWCQNMLEPRMLATSPAQAGGRFHSSRLSTSRPALTGLLLLAISTTTSAVRIPGSLGGGGVDISLQASLDFDDFEQRLRSARLKLAFSSVDTIESNKNHNQHNATRPRRQRLVASTELTCGGQTAAASFQQAQEQSKVLNNQRKQKVSWIQSLLQQDPNPLGVNKKGCYKLTNETDVVYSLPKPVQSPKECGEACESARNLPTYAVIGDGGKSCKCAHELDWSDIGWSEKCDLDCSDGSECGGNAGYSTVYWWHRCPDDDPLNNRCKCPHGEAPTGGECPEDGALSCLHCDRGFELNGETCEPVECVCKSGIATEQMDCPKHGAHHCKACFEDEGFHLNTTTNKCDVNQCVCPGGVGTSGTDCPNHAEDHICASCTHEAGFVMSTEKDTNGTCIERVCTCENGKGARGVECPTHGGESCASCDEENGFKLNGDECVPRECKCANGEAPTGKECPKDADAGEREFCSSCFEDRGFHMNKETDICEVNQCTCKNGEAASGQQCKTHGSEYCLACEENEGYELILHTKQNPNHKKEEDLNTCQLKQCVCGNGTAAIGADCPSTNSTMCTKCKPGFDLTDDGQCIERRCTCPQGEEAIGTDCPVMGELKCMKCTQEGFHHNKEAFTCDVNKCTCDMGSPAEGVACEKHNTPKCIACHAGHTLLNDTHSCVENTCTCGNGTAAVNTGCPKHESAFCSSCNEGYDMDAQNSCNLRHCKCEFGDNAFGKTCPKAGQEKCLRCTEEGFHMNKQDICVVNECTCDKGKAATGALCPEHGKPKCTSCKPGHTLIGDECVKNQCTCENGHGAEGKACGKHKSPLCATCDPGFDLEQGDCKKRKCVCDLGEPAVGTTCPKAGDEKCVKCTTKGYHLNTTTHKCDLNECTCNNGAGASGANCTEHLAPKCMSCQDGYVLIDDKCVEKQCTCEHGAGEKNTKCPVHKEPLCASCDPGYELEDGKCVERVCSCPNGVPKKLTECPKEAFTAKTETCKSCNVTAGYHLVGDKCEVRECICNHGVGTKGVNCPLDGAEVCASCDTKEGYILNNKTQKCDLKQCTCQFGKGATGTDCHANGTEMCAKCNPGAEFMFGMGPPGFCVQNECYCNGGEPATGVGCPHFDAHVCAACNEEEGYALTDEKTCEQKKCTCENGLGAMGAECEEHGTAKCSSCDGGFALDKKTHTCKPKVCGCENGNGAEGMHCPHNGDDVCASCHAGFHLDRDACVENTCNCAHGKGPTGKNCPKDGADVCLPEGCSVGYHFENGKCEKNECFCPKHGEPAKGAMCTEHGAQQCAPNGCDYGFSFDSKKKLCSNFIPEYQGCYEDNGDRDLPARLGPWVGGKRRKRWAKATPEACNVWCHNYEFFAVQAGGECWCGNAVDFAKKPKHECQPCKHDESLMCGSGWRNSVYKHQADVSFAGCFSKDSAKSLQIHSDKDYTFAACSEKCATTTFFALLDGRKCACTDRTDGYSKISDDRCMESACLSADKSAVKTADEWMCGGESALSVYKYAASDPKSECGKKQWKCAGTVAYQYGTNQDGKGKCPAGTTLAIVESSRQQRFVKMLAGREDVFIGAHDKYTEGAWFTADKNQLLKKYHKANWAPGEPNDWGGKEDCAVLRKDNTWNDDNCQNIKSGDRFFVCSAREPKDVSTR
ncbi:unnamed protein product [Amoebophrya sp. A120]|nr:unnamed protein product [Amoebophrya sp. A120]|eukprot:GSA120T00012913001.1